MIPDPDDQKAHRKRRGSRAGRPVTYDRSAYRGALVLAAALLWINDFKASPAPGSTAARPLRAAQLHPGSAGRRTYADTLG